MLERRLGVVVVDGVGKPQRAVIGAGPSLTEQVIVGFFSDEESLTSARIVRMLSSTETLISSFVVPGTDAVTTNSSLF